MSDIKRFVLAYKKELDNGLSGYTMFFTTKSASEVMGARSSAKVLVNEVVDRAREVELKSRIKAMNLKTGKWFTEDETDMSVKKIKSKLGFSVFGKLFGK